MRIRGRRSLLGAIAAIVALGATTIAGAEPPPDGAPPGRFQPVDVTGKKIAQLPRSMAPDAVVTATVQLVQPAAVERIEAANSQGRGMSKQAAKAAVKADQAAGVSAIQRTGARVQGSTQTVLNSITVRASIAQLQQIAADPGVKYVQVARKITIDNAAADRYTGVPQAWQDYGATGEGITIAVIDDGIDYTHANFGGPGTVAAYADNNRTLIEPGTFPTTKVIGGYDFVGDHYDAEPDQAGETDVPQPDPDPLPCGEHGSHVAGTAAGDGVTAEGATYTGPYNATTLDQAFRVAPGAAPQARLLAYKVFGCDGSVDDSIIVEAIDRAVDDGANVINMSLGAPFGRAGGPEAEAIDNAVAAGVMVVASAGNEGPSAYMTGSPATSNRALSVAAVDGSSATLPSLTITIQPNGPVIDAQNSNGATISGPITGELVDVGLGCDAADYAATAGKIAVSHRDVCPRVDRAIHGQAAGALAVIMVNNAPGFPPQEGEIPGVTIPFLGVPQADGAALTTGLTATIALGEPIPNPAYGRFASFTSNGLRTGDSALKPDIAGPGVSIFSTAVGTGTEGLVLSGTSMSGPHVAGVAALVRQTHPDLDPVAVKGILMGTASAEAIGDYSPQRGGAGLVQARQAVDSVAYPWTADGLNNLSFGFDELKVKNSNEKQTFNITNTSDRSITYDLSVAMTDDLGVATIELSKPTITVKAHRTVAVDVKLRISDSRQLPPASASDGGALALIQGRVIATPRGSAVGVYRLAVPFAQVPNALSDVSAKGVTGKVDRRQVTTALELKNTGVITGSADVYQWSISDPAGDNGDPLVPDVRNVGVQSFDIGGGNAFVVFAVNSNASTSTHADQELDVLIDTTGDGAPEFALVAVDDGLLLTGSPNGIVNAFLIDLATNSLVRAFSTVAPANGSSVLLPMLASDVGISGDQGFTFAVAGYTIMNSALEPDVTSTAVFKPFNTAVSTGDYAEIAPNQKVTVPVSFNSAEVAAQGALGWLVVTQDDAGGPAEADGVAVRRG